MWGPDSFAIVKYIKYIGGFRVQYTSQLYKNPKDPRDWYIYPTFRWNLY